MDSRWGLLRKALSGKRDESDSSSIHRHHGFKMLNKKPIVWLWKTLYDVTPQSTWSDFSHLCHLAMISNDNAQLFVTLRAEKQYAEIFKGIIEKLVETQLGRVKTMNTDTDLTEGIDSVELIEAELYLFDKEFKAQVPICKYYQWTLPTLSPSLPEETPTEGVIFTRERLPDAGVGVADLFSHRIHGIDNTGNIKVWDAESILAYLLLTQSEYLHDFQDRRVLELGGGSTGLCGISLAASRSHHCSEIVITDGHPDCVANQNICLKMCLQSGAIDSSKLISCRRLRWLENDPHQELSSLTSSNLFDRIIASDCLFFKEFHSDLLWLLRAALSPDGTVYLLQPRRGETMHRFLSLAEEFFLVTISENYCALISQLHERYLRSEGGYDPDIHFPLLVTLKWKPSLFLRPPQLEVVPHTVESIDISIES